MRAGVMKGLPSSTPIGVLLIQGDTSLENFRRKSRGMFAFSFFARTFLR